MDEQIKAWKSQYGTIYSTVIGGQEYIYRLLNTGECTLVFAYLSSKNEIEAQDVAFRSVLRPESFDPDQMPAYVADILFNVILESSSILSPTHFAQLMDNARRQVNTEFQINMTQWKLAIMQTFHGYTFDTLDAMPLDKFFKLLAFAEKVIGKPLMEQKKQRPSVKGKSMVTNKEYEVPSSRPGKFASQQELEAIAADSATQALREHMKEHRSR